MAGSGISRLKGSAAELRKLQAADQRQRNASEIILSPSDLQGDYNAGRLLKTTLGGVARDITNEDLAAFRHNIRTAGRRFTGGISVRQVIDLSTTQDRKKARTEIPMAFAAASRPNSVGALSVRFITSAGPGSKHSRHQVTVEFVGYSAVVADGSITPQKAAVQLRRGAVKFDCDCEHHRYRRRYIATIGGYNAGRAETGYPKITNPGLSGVACKHVLRVMAEIEGGFAVQSHLAASVQKLRAGKTGRQQTTQKEADRQAAKQALRPMASNAADSGDRDFDRSRKALRKLSRATTSKPKKIANASKRMAALASVPAAQPSLITEYQRLGLTSEEALQAVRQFAQNKAGKQ